MHALHHARPLLLRATTSSVLGFYTGAGLRNNKLPIRGVPVASGATFQAVHWLRRDHPTALDQATQGCEVPGQRSLKMTIRQENW